jgi:enterochelin esterase-like enzyme
MSKVTLLARGFLSLAFCTVLAGVTARAADAAKPQPSAQQDRPKAEWLDPDRAEINGTVWKSFPSKVLGRDVSYRIYLPPGYEQQTQRYPVIYWLHGMNGNQRTGAECFVPHVDAAIREHLLPPVIVVLPNGMVDSFYRDAADGKMPMESVLVKDLIPCIDETYRTIADRSGRAIEGYSMGGYGSAHLGFKYPELFGTVVISAGAVKPGARIDHVNNADYPEEEPQFLAARNAGKLRQTHIRIGVGDQDYLFPANRELHELLDRLKIEHQYEVVPGLKHSGTAYYKTLGTQGFVFHRKALESSADERRENNGPKGL